MLLAVLLLAVQAADARIAEELDRAQQAFAANASTDPSWAQIKPRVQMVLDRARRAARAGQSWAALEDLGKVRTLLEASRSVEQSKGRDFQQAWKDEAPGLIARDAKARGRAWNGIPAAPRAIAESAQGQSVPYLNAAPAYASVTDARQGFFYLAQARALADFADLVASLEVVSKNKPLMLRSWSPELQALQAEVLAAYQPPRSIDQHPDFIGVNAQLKLARELDEGRMPAGALYAWLDALQQFASLELQAPDAAGQARLREQLAAARRQIAASRRDDSIELLFVERGELRAKMGEWPRVRAIVERVLPAYRAAVERRPPAARTAREEIRVTLVRWPYT